MAPPQVQSWQSMEQHSCPRLTLMGCLPGNRSSPLRVTRHTESTDPQVYLTYYDDTACDLEQTDCSTNEYGFPQYDMLPFQHKRYRRGD